VTASNYHENWTYQGGAFEQGFNESWTSGLAQDTLDHVIRDNTNFRLGSTKLPMNSYPVFNLSKPMDGPALTAELAPYFLDWLAHPSYDDYWKQWAIDENYPQITVPALTMTAWYDIFQGGSLRNYMGLRDHAGSETAKNGGRLIVAIGGHSGSGRKIGAVDFGPAAAPWSDEDETLDWYDYLFQGKQNQFADASKPVRIFVMGTNQWRKESAWPPPERRRRGICSAPAERQIRRLAMARLCCNPAPAKTTLPLRSRQPRAHHRWPALLRRPALRRRPA
jgi:putative CocE/NonD family hydrolase